MALSPADHPEFSLTASIPLSISYGIQADTPDDKYIRMFTELLEGANKAAIPGTFFVDIIHPCEHIL